jgi:anti-sigma B factor antagonist
MGLAINLSTPSSGVLMLSLSGVVDLQTRDELITAADDALKQSPSGVVVDMTDVEFLDSTGIGALIQISHDLADAGVDFQVQNPSKQVLRVLEITGLAASWGLGTEDDHA